MSIYRIHDTTGGDLGLLEHPAPNLEPGDVVVVADGRETVVTARVEAEPGQGRLSPCSKSPYSRLDSKPTTRGRSLPPASRLGTSELAGFLLTEEREL